MRPTDARPNTPQPASDARLPACASVLSKPLIRPPPAVAGPITTLPKLYSEPSSAAVEPSSDAPPEPPPPGGAQPQSHVYDRPLALGPAPTSPTTITPSPTPGVCAMRACDACASVSGGAPPWPPDDGSPPDEPVPPPPPDDPVPDDPPSSAQLHGDHCDAGCSAAVTGRFVVSAIPPSSSRRPAVMPPRPESPGARVTRITPPASLVNVPAGTLK